MIIITATSVDNYLHLITVRAKFSNELLHFYMTFTTRTSFKLLF